ncbi:hypothetical protein [Pseudochelatococcus sp. G4_1912]|uniref:hypothetical protein n=1 Tax=Pseudochelatococcus sp. G4_1912 TaxID=3114288 RepID=UPI0039C67833
MNNLAIIIHPLGRGLYEARIGETVVVKSSRTPFLDAARVLLDAGYNPHAQITMQHAGSDTIALRALLSTAAKCAIVEGDRDGLKVRDYQPYPSASDGPAAPTGKSVDGDWMGLR